MSEVTLRRWLSTSLALWAAGVLTVEPLAVAGMGGTVLGVFVSTTLPRVREWRAFLSQWWPLFAFVAWALVAPSVAGHPPSGTGVARTLDWVAVPVAAVAWTRLDSSGRRAVIWTAATVFLVSCAAAGLQHFGVWPSAEAFDPLRFTKIPFDRVYEQVPGTDRFMAGGLAFHRLKFAHVGGLVVVALVVAALRSTGRERALAGAAALVGFVSIALFPYARAATATLLVGCVVAGVLSQRRRMLALGVGAAAAVVAVGLVASVAPLRQRFVSSFTGEGSGDRPALLAAGAKAVSEHPIAGLGPGRFRAKDHAAPDAPIHIREHSGKAHNQFLSMAAETGVTGALLFAAMLIALAAKMRATTAQGAFGAASLVFFVLLSMVHDPLFHAPFSIGIMAALGVGCSRDEDLPA